MKYTFIQQQYSINDDSNKLKHMNTYATSTGN